MFDEALTVFREMYAANTGNPPEDYPVSDFYLTPIKLPNLKKCLIFLFFKGKMSERKNQKCFRSVSAIDNKRKKY